MALGPARSTIGNPSALPIVQQDAWKYGASAQLATWQAPTTLSGVKNARPAAIIGATPSYVAHTGSFRVPLPHSMDGRRHWRHGISR